MDIPEWQLCHSNKLMMWTTFEASCILFFLFYTHSGHFSMFPQHCFCIILKGNFSAFILAQLWIFLVIIEVILALQSITHFLGKCFPTSYIQNIELFSCNQINFTVFWLLLEYTITFAVHWLLWEYSTTWLLLLYWISRVRILPQCAHFFWACC